MFQSFPETLLTIQNEVGTIREMFRTLQKELRTIRGMVRPIREMVRPIRESYVPSGRGTYVPFPIGRDPQDGS
jgi:hypothetical protein